VNTKIKLFVNTPDLWNSFLEELEVRVDQAHKKLGQLTEPHEIYRAQGELQALQSLKKLRDKVNG
jgi:hypothetical protein